MYDYMSGKKLISIFVKAILWVQKIVIHYGCIYACFINNITLIYKSGYIYIHIVYSLL